MLMEVTVFHPSTSPRYAPWYLKPFKPLVIYAMIIPFVLLDVSVSLYQAVYFPLEAIPKVRRCDYVLLDRGRLAKLNIIQRINCLYCDYINGLVAWVKDVVNMTELYSCSIKHSAPRKGQEHQEQYFSYDQFTE